MKLVVIATLTMYLVACAVSPKDYSSAKELQPIDDQLKVTPLWVIPTGDVPEYSHAQLAPVVADNAMFIANINGNVSAYDIYDGNKKWLKKLGEPVSGGPGTGDGMIFVGTSKAEIVSLSQKDGGERWRTRISSEMLSTPVYHNGTVIVQTVDGKISSINANTGKVNWVYSHDIPRLTLRGTASPIVSGNQIISGFADGKIVSIDAGKGELNWSSTINSPKGRTDLERLADIDGVIQSSEDTVFAISYQGRVAAVSLTDGSILWSRKMSSFNGLEFGEEQIFISDIEGKIWALDARTGATLWRQEDLIGRELSTPEVIGNAVVVGDFDAYVHWMSVVDGQIIARQSLKDIWEDAYPTYHNTVNEEYEYLRHHRLVTAKPLAVNDTLYVRDNEGALVALHVKK